MFLIFCCLFMICKFAIIFSLMFYEQLKPNKVINHCKSVLKYTHQFLPADISQASASGWVNKLLF